MDEFASKLESMDDEEFSNKPNPKKWSKKEVIGHLIDSGQNNLRRFIVCQYESKPPKIVYDQDFWVSANNYQSYHSSDVIALWKLVNEQIIHVLSRMIETNYAKTCDTSKADVQLRTLDWLASDYVMHLKHHLNQVFKGSFDIVYP